MLLALDTATTTASLALYDLDAHTLLAEWTWQARRRHTQDTLAALHLLLEQQGLTPADLTACAVTTGPGSFTGVRIGVSLAKGLALGAAPATAGESGESGDRRGLRLLGAPTLCVTAAPWLPLLPQGALLCAFIQAGRGRYNWAWFTAGDALRLLTREDHTAGDAAAFAAAVEAATAQGAAVWLAGEHDAALAQALARIDAPGVRPLLLDETTALRRAGHLARFAARFLARGEDSHALESLEPIYLAPA